MSAPTDSPLLSLTVQGPPEEARAVLAAIRAHAVALGIEPLSPLLHTALADIRPDGPAQLFAVARPAGTVGVGHA